MYLNKPETTRHQVALLLVQTKTATWVNCGEDWKQLSTVSHTAIVTNVNTLYIIFHRPLMPSSMLAYSGQSVNIC